MEEERGGSFGPFEDLEVIRQDAGMPTARFVKLIGVPERSYRRWQAKARTARSPKGPWPQPSRVAVRDVVIRHASAHPAWGHRKVWAMTRHDGHRVSQATVLRLLRDEGLILPAHYQRERRKLAERRKAAFAKEPTAPNQVWQLDFSEYETTTGGTWRIAACRDYWSKYEFDAHVSPTANMHDAVEAVQKALDETERLLGHPLIDDAAVDPATGEIEPVVTIVTDNGGPFRSLTFELFVLRHPELKHVRTKVRTPGQNGSRERGFGSMKYEWLFREEIDDALQLVEHVNAYRHDYNHVRPHEAIAWNRPAEVHAGLADPTIPNFEIEETLPTT